VYRVNQKAPLGLNVRVAPNATATRIAVLPMGQLVDVIGGPTSNGWVIIHTTLQGSIIEGNVNGAFLSKVDEVELPPTQSNLAVHLDPGKLQVTRNNRLLAYPLNEVNMPKRVSTADAQTRVKQLTDIIAWADVEKHARYAPNPSNTYCNIYAADYAYLGGVYLPRVWWYAQAYADLKQGKQVSPIYAKTVGEVNANGLFTWITQHGGEFGWVRMFDLTQVQNAANDGRVCVIVAQQKIPNRSGHICAIVPETANLKAVRSWCNVTRPLQSQAGRTNKRYWTPTQWWNDPKYREFGFWVNSN
jgi:hypothetical protein